MGEQAMGEQDPSRPYVCYTASREGEQWEKIDTA